MTRCNCSICRRYGVLWAYYRPAQVQIVPPSDSTDIYMWDDRSIEFHRCRVCGCVTLEVVAAARVRKLDGAATERYLDEDAGG